MCWCLNVDEERLKSEICRVMRHLYERGFVTALSGNVSARLPGAKEFWITPSHVFKGGLRPEDLIKIDLNGNIIEGRGKPSIETPMHIAIYRVRPDVNAVVHAHNPFTVGLTSIGISLEPVTVEAAEIIESVEIVPYAPPGSEQLAKLVAEKASRGAKAIILQGHGVVALGSDIHEAEAIVEALEETAIVQFIALALNKKPFIIPKPKK